LAGSLEAVNIYVSWHACSTGILHGPLLRTLAADLHNMTASTHVAQEYHMALAPTLCSEDTYMSAGLHQRRNIQGCWLDQSKR